LQARLINKMMRKLTSAQNAEGLDTDNRPTILLLNQVRMKVGVLWGNPETKPGGMGQEFATSIDLRMWPGKYTQDKAGNTLSMITNVRCTKNKVSPAQMSGNFRLWLRDYADHAAGDTEDKAVVLGQAVKYSLFGNSQDGWKYKEKEFGSRKDAIKYFLHDRDAYEELRTFLFTTMLGTIACDEDTLKIEEDDDVEIGTSDSVVPVNDDELVESVDVEEAQE
jgi:recombination protein RecA